MSTLTARQRIPTRRQTPTGVRRRGRSGLPRWVWTLAIAAIIVLSAVAFATTFLELYRLQREADRLVRMRMALQQETAVLREEIRALHTPEYIERIAREQLGLVKPGEIVLLIVKPPAPVPAPVAPPPEDPPWIVQLWQALVRLVGR